MVWGEKTWTWAQQQRRVNAMAAALQKEFGVVKGDRILVQSQNCNQMFESMFACFQLGAVWVPANFRQTSDEVAYLAATSGAKGLICGNSFPAHVEACRQTSAAMEFVIAIGKADFAEDYDDIVDRFDGEMVPTAPVDHDDPCWFFFTSGTTGRPEGGSSDPRSDGIRGYQPPVRLDAGDDAIRMRRSWSRPCRTALAFTS